MATDTKDNRGAVHYVVREKAEIGFMDYENDPSLLSNKPNEDGPVVISSPFPSIGGRPRSILVGKTSECSMTIKNITSETVKRWRVRIYGSNPPDSFSFSFTKLPSANSKSKNTRHFTQKFYLEGIALEPHTAVTIWLSCKPKDIGLHTSVLHFDIGDYRIERVVFVLAENDISQSLASDGKTSIRAPRGRQFAAVVNQYQFSSRNSRVLKYKLPEFPIPQSIRELVKNEQVPHVLREGLKRENYTIFFSALLVLEELHMEEEMKCYDMKCVMMKRKGPKLVTLQIPGLAERRPSLAQGDAAFAKLSLENAGPDSVFEGKIHRSAADEVLLKFSKKFYSRHKNGNLYNVWFSYNRLNMRRMHQAIQFAEKLEADLLFPSKSRPRRMINSVPFVPFNRDLNEEQNRCIEMILGCRSAPPYVIYGPPGTGKTSTMVEAILQAYTKRNNSRILVCAASNSAADHILEKIISNEDAQVQENEIFRLNGRSRSCEDVQSDHIRFCYFDDSAFKCPHLRLLNQYRIIISTYMSSSLLYSRGVGRGYFSHIFLDEAGQASEPESMVPISYLCQRKTVVVLAGDPKQLGPVIHSKNAEDFGLGKSYLERLFECEYYNNEDEYYLTKLVRNYRCHLAILDLPSKLFYAGDLLACKEDNSSSITANMLFLPNKQFPVLFFGILGCNERERNNPSWFNRIEASKVVEIISMLRVIYSVNEADIGVITPYRQQVIKIENVLETQGVQGIKVGSVEQFQGQEREVIIVSTVRSTMKHREFDRVHCLGFLSNPRRFNVAITRAKSLLVIVGNPHIVGQDPHWNKLLEYCCSNNSYAGCHLPQRLHA